jgi:beta-glucosidase
VLGSTFEIDPDPNKLLAEAVDIAKRVEVAILVVGESKEMSGECSSRTDIRLPRCQRNLIQSVIETGTPVALVVMSGRPLDLSWESKHVSTILWAPFGGSEAGSGIADLLLGKRNPSGKLSMTFPRHVGQVPIYYASRPTGRPLPDRIMEAKSKLTLSERNEFVKFYSCYSDRKSSPLFAFGHGVSYTTFEYGALSVNKSRLAGRDDNLEISVRVKNTGSRAGSEVVQLYISGPMPCSITRPVRELKDFKIVELSASEETAVEFRITTTQLEFSKALGIADCERVWEGGQYTIGVGGASDQLSLIDVHWET